MGFFGGGKKAAEQAEQAERDRERDAINVEMKRRQEAGYLAMDEWLDRVGRGRSPGSGTLTNDLLATVGPPPFPEPLAEHPRHGAVITARSAVKSYGATNADRRRYNDYESEEDRSLTSFWASVKSYLEGLS